MAIAHFAISYCTIVHNGILAFVFILMFQVSFNLTYGPIFWLLLPEVLNDQQFGLCATIHYANGIEISMVTEYMVRYLTVPGVFAFYGSMCTIAFLVIHIWFKETSGLSDK